MLVTLKDTTFDEGDYGCLEVDGGSYLAYSEDAECYGLLNSPVQLMRGKAIAVNAPVGGSVEEIRAFAVDRPPNSVDFVLVGLLYRAPTGSTWIAGNRVGDALPSSVHELGDALPWSVHELALKGGSSKDQLLLPPLHFRYPKEKPSNMSKNQLLAKIAAEAEIRTHRILRRFGLLSPEKFDLHLLINRDSFSDIDEDEQMEVEAHNLNSSSNVWSMEQLNSSLGNCTVLIAKNITRVCFVPEPDIDSDEDKDEQVEVEAHNLNSSSKVWSIVQLNSSLGK